MADKPGSTEPAPRIFEKKVGDQTLTRTVTSVQAAVAARFDGFHEKTPAKSTASGSRPSGTGSPPS